MVPPVSSLLYTREIEIEAGSMYGRNQSCNLLYGGDFVWKKLMIDLLKSIMEALLAAETESKLS